MTISKVPLRTHSALLSVALAAALAGCGSAPTKPAFAPGYTPTEAEMGLAEQNSATALPSSTAAELKSKGVLPYYTDTRLLYLAALQRQGALGHTFHPASRAPMRCRLARVLSPTSMASQSFSSALGVISRRPCSMSLT